MRLCLRLRLSLRGCRGPCASCRGGRGGGGRGLGTPLRVARLAVVHVVARQRPPRTAPAAGVHAVAPGLAGFGGGKNGGRVMPCRRQRAGCRLQKAECRMQDAEGRVEGRRVEGNIASVSSSVPSMHQQRGGLTSAEVACYDLRSTAPAAAAARRRARRRRRRAPARDRLGVLERHQRHPVVLRPVGRRRERGDRREVRVHGRPAGGVLVGSAELRRARTRTRACACDRGEGGGALLAWLDRCAQGRKRVREKHAHVRASPGVRRGRRQLGRARRVVEVGRAVFDAVTLAIAAVLFPLLARRAALGARGVVARVRTLEALPACRPAAVALELPRCNPPKSV